MNFWFEYFDILMNKKTTIYHDFHGFVCDQMPFLVHWIVTTFEGINEFFCFSSTMTYNGMKKIWIFVLELAMMCERVKGLNCQAFQLDNTIGNAK